MDEPSIALDLEESNELMFKVKVTGLDPAPAKVRLVCESGDVAYMFSGHAADEPDVVRFVLPNMSGKLAEGTYRSRVEVLIDNRYFSPVQFNIEFRKAVKVVAEAITPVRRTAPPVSVTVTPVAHAQAKPTVPAPARTTLKERYARQPGKVVHSSESDVDEDLIKELARSFVRSKKRR